MPPGWWPPARRVGKPLQLLALLALGAAEPNHQGRTSGQQGNPPPGHPHRREKADDHAGGSESERVAGNLELIQRPRGERQPSRRERRAEAGDPDCWPPAGDSSRPSGNSRTTQARAVRFSGQIQLRTQAASGPRSNPGRVRTA